MIAAFGLFLGLVGCGGSTPEPPAVATITTARMSSSTPSQLRPVPAIPTAPGAGVREAIRVYELMLQDFARAAATSDHSSSLLARHATDQALRELRGVLFLNSVKGIILLGHPTPTPRVLAVRVPELPIEVQMSDCFDDAAWPQYKFDGGVVDKQPTGRRRIDATARVERDVWRVTRLSFAEPGTC